MVVVADEVCLVVVDEAVLGEEDLIGVDLHHAAGTAVDSGAEAEDIHLTDCVSTVRRRDVAPGVVTRREVSKLLDR